MWGFRHFMTREHVGLDGRVLDIGNLKIQVRNAIAEGGFSFVYLASDVHSGEQYALKHIICNDEESLELVRKEIDVMKLLKGHPNVVTLYGQTIMDLGRTKEAFLVMEFCEKSLVNTLESRGAGYFDERQILLIFRDACNAIFAMHNQTPPVAHRDLKAENLLLGKDGTWKLCDFGSISTEHKRYVRAEEMGIEEDNIRKHTTPAYRAPEMWDLLSRELINERVDMWALGCLLYKICYLKSAFDGESKLQILNGNYRIPELPRYSSSITGLIKDMLQTNPDARPDITQVWFRVNEQLPVELQKEMPDTPVCVTPKEAHQGKGEGSPVPQRNSLTPSRHRPPTSSSRERVQNPSSVENNSKSSESFVQAGNFWYTVHAEDYTIFNSSATKFAEENNGTIAKKNPSPQEIKHSSHDIRPQKENHPKVGNYPKKGTPVSSNSSGASGTKGTQKDIGGTFCNNDAFNAFIAEFDSTKLNSESVKMSEGKLRAEVEKLKEELKQASVEKAEIADKYEKLAAICRSQRQEIQELKRAVASGGPPQYQNGSWATGGGSRMHEQAQNSSGSCQGNGQQSGGDKRLEGSLWEHQQGMLTNCSWHPFADNQPNNSTTSAKAMGTGKNGRAAWTATMDGWGFGEDSLTANPGHSQSSGTSTNVIPHNFGAVNDQSSSQQPGGWAGF